MLLFCRFFSKINFSRRSAGGGGGGGGGAPHAAVWTDAMDESFAQPLARGLEGCPFRVEDLCLRVEETPACREVAADLCALLRRQDI